MGATSTEDTLVNDTRGQHHEQNSDRMDPVRGREISEITHKHLEQVLNAMIPSSTCSSSDQTESAPVNSLVTQTSYKDTEEPEARKSLKEGEKQVIVNNYYTSDKETGWKRDHAIHTRNSGTANTWRDLAKQHSS